MKFTVMITDIEAVIKGDFSYSLTLLQENDDCVPDEWVELTVIDIDTSKLLNKELLTSSALNTLAKEEQEFNLKVHEKNLEFKKRKSELLALPNLSKEN